MAGLDGLTLPCGSPPAESVPDARPVAPAADDGEPSGVQTAAATVYFVLGSVHEEARLRADYGPEYRDYQRSGVPFLFPRWPIGWSFSGVPASPRLHCSAQPLGHLEPESGGSLSDQAPT